MDKRNISEDKCTFCMLFIRNSCYIIIIEPSMKKSTNKKGSLYYLSNRQIFLKVKKNKILHIDRTPQYPHGFPQPKHTDKRGYKNSKSGFFFGRLLEG